MVSALEMVQISYNWFCWDVGYWFTVGGDISADDGGAGEGVAGGCVRQDMEIGRDVRPVERGFFDVAEQVIRSVGLLFLSRLFVECIHVVEVEVHHPWCLLRCWIKWILGMQPRSLDDVVASYVIDHQAGKRF